TSEDKRAHKLHALLCVAIIILCCAPWTIRNYVRFHRLIPLRSSLPFELWIGNNDIFDEHAVGGVRRITRFGEVRLYTQLGENAYLDEKRRLAWDFIRTHPALEARLTFRPITAPWLAPHSPRSSFSLPRLPSRPFHLPLQCLPHSDNNPWRNHALLSSQSFYASTPFRRTPLPSHLLRDARLSPLLPSHRAH